MVRSYSSDISYLRNRRCEAIPRYVVRSYSCMLLHEGGGDQLLASAVSHVSELIAHGSSYTGHLTCTAHGSAHVTILAPGLDRAVLHHNERRITAGCNGRHARAQGGDCGGRVAISRVAKAELAGLVTGGVAR